MTVLNTEWKVSFTVVGTTLSVHTKSRLMGMRSSSQLFGDDIDITFLTSSSYTPAVWYSERRNYRPNWWESSAHRWLKAKSRSDYSHGLCFTYCQGFHPWTHFYLPGPFTFIFSPNLSWVSCGLRTFLYWFKEWKRSTCSLSRTTDAGSCVECPRTINRPPKCVTVHCDRGIIVIEASLW